MIFPRNVAGICPQCRGALTHVKDNEDRRWLHCCCCGAQLPEDWMDVPRPHCQCSIPFKAPLRGVEINPSAS